MSAILVGGRDQRTHFKKKLVTLIMIMVKLVKVISEEKIFVIFHRLKQDDGNKVMRTAHLHNIITQV